MRKFIFYISADIECSGETIKEAESKLDLLFSRLWETNPEIKSWGIDNHAEITENPE